jgi:hypothetical protein
MSVRPGDSYFLGIKGFKLSGFQYLRMLFGAQTTKPDVHIVKFISEIVGRKVHLRLLRKQIAGENPTIRVRFEI